MPASRTANLYIGLISGTSCDAVDAALVDFSEHIQVVDYQQHALEDDLREQLKRGPELTASQISEVHRILGEAFARAAQSLLAKGGDRVVAVGSHGQTLYHHARTPVHSLQVGDPSIIAQRTGITTVADFRSMDIAAGGQGAPLAPALHAWAFRQRPIAVINIGGIANITLLFEDGTILGFDCGPGNALLDAWSQRHRSEPFDRDGAWAGGGEIDGACLARLLEDEYFARPAPKTTGPEYFNLQWLASRLDLEAVQPRDLQATLTALTAESIGRALQAYPEIRHAYLCGGGVHNGTLVALLSAARPGLRFASTAQLGLDPDCVEAVLFAWLAKRRLEGKPGNIPSVTGAAREVVLGAVYEPLSNGVSASDRE